MTAKDTTPTLIGRVSVQWNNCQFWLFMMFETILDRSPNAETIFFAVRSDRGQRDLVKEVIRNHPDFDSSVRDGLCKTIEKFEGLAGARNDILHAMMLLKRGAKARVMFPTRNRFHKRDIKKELRALQEKLLYLESELIHWDQVVHQAKMATRAKALGKALKDEP
jgi:hypothetical protein